MNMHYVRRDGSHGDGGNYLVVGLLAAPVIAGFFAFIWATFGCLAAFGGWGLVAIVTVYLLRKELTDEIECLRAAYRWLWRHF